MRFAKLGKAVQEEEKVTEAEKVVGVIEVGEAVSLRLVL
jgi:hypothetical protein